MRKYEKEWGRALRVCIVALVGITIAGASSCQPDYESGDTVPDRDINAVMDAHVGELMAIPGVTGVAVGELDDGTPCILILIVEQSEELDRKIPKVLEGHPVRVTVSGEIAPMNSG